MAQSSKREFVAPPAQPLVNERDIESPHSRLRPAIPPPATPSTSTSERETIAPASALYPTIPAPSEPNEDSFPPPNTLRSPPPPSDLAGFADILQTVVPPPVSAIRGLHGEDEDVSSGPITERTSVDGRS